MTDIDTLTKRLNEVEALLVHQQEAIRELSDVATAQWQTIDALSRRVADLTSRLQAAQSDAAMAVDEPPPPHY